MTPTAPPIDRRAAEAIRNAARCEARGDFDAALAAWAEAHRWAPDALPVRLGHAQAQLRAGAWQAALPALERIVAERPDHPAPALALAHALALAGRQDDAIAAAERAVALAPGLAAVHAGLGDVLRGARRIDDAARAYERACALAPRDADLANKLAGALRASGRTGAAAKVLDRALADHPGHPLLRVNRGTLAAALGDWEDARARLAPQDAPLPPDAQATARETLAMLDEGERLAPALRAWVDGAPDEALAAALRETPFAAAPDRNLVERAARVAASCRALDPDMTGVPACVAVADWPRIEARYNASPTATPGATGGPANAGASAEDGDRARYARLVERRASFDWPPADAAAFEALLRGVHAALCGHREGRAAGCFKPAENVVLGGSPIARAQPAQVRPTLAAAFDADFASLPAGVPRAVWLWTLVGLVHPFLDGNGRVARFLVNVELVHAGGFPHVVVDDASRKRAGRALGRADEGDVRELARWLADASRAGAEARA